MQFLSKTAKFHNTKKLKKIATHSYAEAYYQILEKYFGPVFLAKNDENFGQT